MSKGMMTERQREVLDFIAGFIIDREYSPTLREIGAAMGIKSTNGVNDHLESLRRKGYLMHTEGSIQKSRVLRISAKGRSLYAKLSRTSMSGKLDRLQRLVDGFPNNVFVEAEDGCQTPLDGATVVVDIVGKILKDEY